MINYRSWTDDDVDSVLDLLNQLQNHGKHPRSPITAADLNHFKRDNLVQVIVADDGHKLVGYAMFYYIVTSRIGKQLWLEDIYVTPEVRSQKVGFRLMTELIRIAADQSVSIKLEAVNWNRKAIEFYEKIGFVETHRYQDADYANDVWFCYKLSADKVTQLAHQDGNEKKKESGH